MSPSSTSSPVKFSSLSLSAFALARVGVERARERGAEAGDMGAAFGVVNIVGERQHSRDDVIDILERYFDHRRRRASFST